MRGLTLDCPTWQRGVGSCDQDYWLSRDPLDCSAGVPLRQSFPQRWHHAKVCHHHNPEGKELNIKCVGLITSYAMCLAYTKIQVNKTPLTQSCPRY